MKITISYPDSLRRVSLRGERDSFSPSIEFSNLVEARAFAFDFLSELFNIKVSEVE